MKSFWFSLLCYVLTPAVVIGQQVEVHGGFVQDSLAIGEPGDYFLTARYSSELTLLFPDSTFEFSPFEFSKKRYFVTVTRQGLSYDSVVYQLQTFEIDSIQTLALPVFLPTLNDCLRYEPFRDSIYLRALVKTLPPDTLQAQDLPLKTNTEYHVVSLLFNYPVIVIIAGSLLMLSLIVWIIFGKKIRKHFRVKRLLKDHNKFITAYSQQVQLLQGLFSPQTTEQAVSLWKKYLEKLERKPFTKLTTRETIQLEHDEQLGNMLKVLDRAIYGNYTAVSEPLHYLQKVATHRFGKILDAIKHG